MENNIAEIVFVSLSRLNRLSYTSMCENRERGSGNPVARTKGRYLISVTKLSVLLIFAEAKGFLTPDQVCGKLQPSPDRRSVYSYLARLRGQGLLQRVPNPRRGSLSYRLTSRGEERIAYLRGQKR